MVNMMKMLKQAAAMQKEMKEIQKGLAMETAEGVSGGGAVTVVARGDMSVESVKIEPKAIDPSKPELLEKLIVFAVNKALEGAKKKAGGAMSKVAANMGLGNLLGNG